MVDDLSDYLMAGQAISAPFQGYVCVVKFR
jgi:hypothetical protein